MVDCRAVPARDYARSQPFIEAEAEIMRSARTILGTLCAALITLALIPVVASAIPRDVVLARGNVWVLEERPL